MTTKHFSVLVTGELNVDLLLNRIDSFPEIGKETLAGSMTLALGSSSAIFASNLSSLSTKVAFVGKVGADLFGDFVIQSLQKKNVITEFIIRDTQLNTGATVVLNFGEERAMVTHTGSMEHLTISDISDDMLLRSEHLHFSSAFLQTGIKNDLALLFKRAKDSGLTTSFDTQWDPEEQWDLPLDKILPYVDVFLPNKAEAMFLTRTNSVEDALTQLGKAGNIIVIKLDKEGSLSYHSGDKLFVPSFLNTNVVDTIGAGDSFNAGFIHKFIQLKTVAECQTFANLTGAVSTTAAGGTSAFTDLHSIMKIAQDKFAFTGD